MIKFQKIFLYGALVVIALTLWNEWKREQAPSVGTTSTITQTSTVPLSDNTNINVPTVSVPSSIESPIKPVITSKDSSRYIKVKTNVLEIVIDKQGGNIIKNSLLRYHKQYRDSNFFVLMSNDPQQLYISQSGLTGSSGPDTQQGQAFYSSARNSYELVEGENQLIVDLTWKNTQGLQVIKRYTFYRDKYVSDLTYFVKNLSTKIFQGYPYAQLQRKEPPKQSALFHYGLFVGGAISSPDKHYQKLSFKDMAKDPLSQNISDGWVAMIQHYFLSAWVPPVGQAYSYYSRGISSNDSYILGMIGPAIIVAPQQTATTNFKFYSGPAIAENLDAVAPHLSLTIDYGWLWFISSGLFWVMKHIYAMIGNWGWSVIILTFLIKLVFYQLSAKSYRSMANMRRLQPRMQKLKERYGDDRQKMSQAMMDMYRNEKVNPLSGCLPILVQIPFFIALYYMIIESVELRQAPFVFWIHDLSIADPYYILPVIMGGLMFLQQKLNPPAPDPMQQKVMMFLPVIFTVFFFTFPAGLVLYWITNTALGALQQWWMLRQVNKEETQRSHSLNN